MKRFLLSAALLLACSGVALAQESEISGGGGGGITAAPGSGTAGRVPQFASSSSLEDSKMLTSGTNSGTWTLYDPTATDGATSLVIRGGDYQQATGGGYPLAVYQNDGTTLDFAVLPELNTGYTVVRQLRWVGNTDGGFSLTTEGLSLNVSDASSGQPRIAWKPTTYDATDTALLREAPGIVGQRAGTTAQAFRVYKTYTDASNYERLSIYYDGGFGTWGISPQYAGTGAAQHLVVNANGGSLYLTGVDVQYGGTYNWIVRGVDGTLEPGNWDNTADLGNPSNRIQDAYIASSIQGTNSVTLTAATDDPFVQIAVPVGGTVGGYVEYTIVADDATDYQARSGILPFAVVNKAGTETITIGTVGAATEVFAESAGASTLTNTFTTDNATGSNNVRIRANVVSSLAETTLAIKCRVVITSGTATLTFNP